MNVLSILRAIHIAAGALALLVMAVPLVAKKGSLAHRRFGKIFTRAMMVVAVTGVPLVVVRVMADAQAGLFLGQIMLLTAMSIAFGLRALSAKRPGLDFPLERAGAVLVLAVSLGGVAFSVWREAPVFIGFGALTAFLAVQWLRFFSNPYKERFSWFLMHMTGMCTLAISALTAFTVTNALAIGVPHSLRWLAWLGPPALGAAGIAAWQRLYRARFQTEPVAG